MLHDFGGWIWSRIIETGYGSTHWIFPGQHRLKGTVTQGMSDIKALDLWIIQMGKCTLCKQKTSLPQVCVSSVAARRLDRNIYLLHNLIAHATLLVDVPLMNQMKSGH